MTVYDCFTFADELDTLEVRLATLAPVVDVFVLVESKLTLARKPKPLHFQKNAKRFEAWADKIRVVTVDLPDGDRWACEWASRDAAMSALDGAQPDDWVCFGDVDEIPHPSHIAARKPGAVWCQPFRYYFNVATDEYAPNTICMTYGELVQRGGFSAVRRDQRFNLQPYRLGWHFSTLGDVVEHLKTRTHAEYDAKEWHDVAKANRAALKDPLGRPISLWPVGLQELPQHIQDNAARFDGKIYKQ